MTATTAAPRGPYRTGVKRRRKILEVAAEVFGQYGYAGGSLRQIADQVGVTPATLIKHFGSKESLLVAVLEYWSDETIRAVELEGADARSMGLAYFRRMERVMQYHVTHRGLLELFLTLTIEATNLEHPARPFIVERYRALISNATAALREASRRGEVKEFSEHELDAEVRGMIAMMDGIEIQWMLDPSVDLVATFRSSFARIIESWSRGLDELSTGG